MEKHLNPSKKVEITNSDEKKKKEKEQFNPKVYFANTIGSDEVGTGDYFGPIVVCATYVCKENIPFLEELGVRDSKKLTDEKILEIVPKIIEVIPYECIILSNKEYNERYSQDMNMNKVKAILHNKVLSKMLNYNYDYIVVDQFAIPYVYYNTSGKIKWSSSNKKVVQVVSTGKNSCNLKAVKEGTVLISAQNGNMRETFTVVVASGNDYINK